MSAPPNDNATWRGGASGRQEQEQTRNITTTAERERARERFRRAKLHLTHAAAACIAGEAFSGDWANAALAELNAARAELALLAEPHVNESHNETQRELARLVIARAERKP